MSVASSSSVRQRVQSLGRVLWRRFDGHVKKADMHIVYVADTVDELTYAKEDWSDLTGEAANNYLSWPLDATAPLPQQRPPRTPRAKEKTEWERLGKTAPTGATPWLGHAIRHRFLWRVRLPGAAAGRGSDRQSRSGYSRGWSMNAPEDRAGNDQFYLRQPHYRIPQTTS